MECKNLPKVLVQLSARKFIKLITFSVFGQCSLKKTFQWFIIYEHREALLLLIAFYDHLTELFPTGSLPATSVVPEVSRQVQKHLALLKSQCDVGHLELHPSHVK